MDKNVVNNIIKSSIFGLILGVALFACATIVTSFTQYIFKDVLFVEGIVFVMIGVASSIGGNPMGLSIQGLGKQNAQYISNANLEATKYEKEKLNIKTTITLGFSTVSLLIGGIVSVLVSFII